MADRYPLHHDLSVDIFEDGSAQLVTWGKNIELSRETVAGVACALIAAMSQRKASVTESNIDGRPVVIITVDCSESRFETIREDLISGFKRTGGMPRSLVLFSREPFTIKKLTPEQRRELIDELQRAEVAND